MKKLVFILMLFIITAGILADGTNTSTGAPQVMILPYTDTGDMIDNTNDNGQRGRDEWWEISPTLDLTNLNIHVDFNSWDGYLYVYDANMNQIAFDDDGPGGIYTSEVIINVNAGSTIFVCVDEYSASTGTRAFTLNVSADQVGPISDPDAPMPATNSFPTNNAMNIPLDATLTWDFGANTETYDLFFDTVNPPVNQVVTGGTANGTGSYTPTGLLNATTYYWRVVSHNSLTTTATPANFYFQTELATNLIQIGNGTITNQHLPIEPYNAFSYTQSIYLQSEINMQSLRIEKVYYHYNGSATLANSTQWVIYMGHTTESAFAGTGSWIPMSSLTPVFDGVIANPTGDEWIEIILQTPFVYNNVDNLVIAVEENSANYGSSSEEFFCQSVTGSRSLYYVNNTTDPDPVSPPTGNLSSYIPETRLFFDALPTLPELTYNPATWDFGTLYCNTASNPVVCSAQNTGTGILNIQSVVLDDNVNFTLSDNNTYPLALDTAENINFNVIFNPIDDGPLTGTVTITDDLRQTYDMTFTGIGFNATISAFPYLQNFENAGAIPIGWEQGLDDEQNWSFGTSTSSVNTGPQAGDHTTGTGYFAYTEASSNLNMRFDLLAPPVDISTLTNPFCTVWYNMYGQTMGTLHFDIWDGTQWVEDFAPSISGDQGQDWHMLDFSLAGYGDVVQVRFRGITGSNYYSDISIDDVAFWDNGAVPGPTTLVAPLDGDVGVPMTGAVSWNATPGAGGYYVNIGTDNPPTNIYNMADAGAALSFDYSGLTSGVLHYWQIIPYNAIGNAVNCPVWSFTTFNQVPNPATLVSPQIGATYQNVFPTLVWSSGGNFPDGYKLNLGTDNPPTDVYNNDDLGFVTTYVVPTQLNPQTVYYWQIIPYNFVGDATNCPIWNFTTAPEGLVVVGDGTVEGQPLPIEPYFGYSYSQTIYLQSELNVQGQRIESILYHYDGAATLNNEYEWVIYMAHTTETQFATTSSWLPIDQFTEVFNATIAPPTGEGWIEFVLDTPFIYNNTDNLVVAVEENQPAYGSSSEDFYCTATSTNRSIYHYSDSVNADPAAPPTAGGIRSFIPNTMFYFDDLPVGPELFYRPLSYDFGTVFTNTQTTPVTFTLQNTGIGDLIISSIALSDATDYILTDTNTYPITLGTAQSASISVAFAPINEGPLACSIVVTDQNDVSNIPLTGTGFNQTVSIYPYTETFDIGSLPIGWEQGTEDEQDWSFGISTPSVNTGPQIGDHTSGTGSFAYTEASSNLNTRFDLLSPPLNVASLSNPFMTIWYNMYGQTMGDLHFDVWNGTAWVEDIFPAISGDQGQDWHFVDVSLGGYGDLVRVRFRGVTGSNYYSDISIDDFSVWDNNQPPAGTSLVEPADNATGIAMTGNISWIPAAAASGYYVSMGTDNPPTDVYDLVDVGNTLSFAYSGLQPGVQYYWMITPYNPIGQATNCPVWSFTTFNDIPNPAILVYPVDGAQNMNPTMVLEWASGGNYPDGYRLYLGTDNPPTSIFDGLDVGFTTTYAITTPLEYSTQYFWRVIPYNFVGDAINCPIWTFEIHPAGMVIMGDEMLTDKHLPIEPYYGYSYSQSIHTFQEIGMPGFITSVGFYYNGAATLNNSTQWVIYIGMTDQNEFATSSSWIPLTELSEVWNGTITAPTGAGWIDFTLDETSWFLYDGSQNLVIAVEENQPAYGSSSEEFYCSAKPNNRSIYYYNDSTNPDPAAPPNGTTMAFIPNTRLFTLPTGDNPYPIITPSSLNFGFVNIGSDSDIRTITIRNVGHDSLYIDASISIQGDDAGEFTLIDNNTYPVQINYLETVDISVQFSPTSEGWKNASILITDNAPDAERSRTPRQIHNLPISGRGYFLDGNDEPFNATQVQLNLNGYEEMIYPENETDWYVFWQTAMASVTMYTEAINGSQLDTYMCLYGPYDSPNENVNDLLYIMADDDSHGSDQPQIDMPITESGFYYLRISHFQNVPAGMRPFKKRDMETRATIGEYALTIISDNLTPPEVYLPPINFACESLFNGVELSWDPPVAPARSLAGYNVYRDDVALNTATVNSTMFIDYDAVIGETYEYKVSTVYIAPPGESAPCDSINYTHIAVDAPIISESFETYTDFTTSFYPWTCSDEDGEATYGFSNGIDFPGEHSEMAFLIFNPTATTPPLMFASAYSGDKYAACFAADTGANDDWMITPHLDLGEETTQLSFWARSYTTQYGPEMLTVNVSTTGNDPSNFTQIGGTEPLAIPLAWTYFEFDLTDYADQQIYIGFNCISQQTFYLMIDEIIVNSNGGAVDNNEQIVIPGVTQLFTNYPNPFNPETTISFALKQNEKVAINIYNIKGQKVKTLTNDYFDAGNHQIIWNGKDQNNRQVSSGIYFFKMEAGSYTHTKKMILMK